MGSVTVSPAEPGSNDRRVRIYVQNTHDFTVGLLKNFWDDEQHGPWPEEINETTLIYVMGVLAHGSNQADMGTDHEILGEFMYWTEYADDYSKARFDVDLED